MEKWTAQVEIEIPFHDIDGMSVVWHGNYYKYFEIARTRLQHQLKFDFQDMQKGGYLWPIIESTCRYVSPLRYGMKIQVVATIKEYEHRLKIVYQVLDAATKKRMAKGHTVQVAVGVETGEMRLVSPDTLFYKLGLDPPKKEAE